MTEEENPKSQIAEPIASHEQGDIQNKAPDLPDYIRQIPNHSYKIGIPLVIFGPLLWLWFNNAQNNPVLKVIPMYQLLFLAVPIVSIILTVWGLLIITNYFYKKKRESRRLGIAATNNVHRN